MDTVVHGVSKVCTAYQELAARAAATTCNANTVPDNAGSSVERSKPVQPKDAAAQKSAVEQQPDDPSRHVGSHCGSRPASRAGSGAEYDSDGSVDSLLERLTEEFRSRHLARQAAAAEVDVTEL
jgi:hypothetical protein